MFMGSLTVAILNWNGAEYLEECLKSIPSSIEAERILVDNASTDDSWKIAERYGFRVVHANNEHKFITGINTAITESKGDYILFSQADVVFMPECIERLYKLAHSDIIVQPMFLRDGLIDNAGMKIVWPGYGVGEMVAEPHRTEVCTTITFLAPRRLYEIIGLYDTNLSPAYYEDVDWAIRAKAFKITHYVNSYALVKHRHNASFSKEYDKLAISEICRKNRRYLIKKHYRGLDRLLRLAVSTCLDVAKKAFDVITHRRVKANKGH